MSRLKNKRLLDKAENRRIYKVTHISKSLFQVLEGQIIDITNIGISDNF